MGIDHGDAAHEEGGFAGTPWIERGPLALGYAPIVPPRGHPQGVARGGRGNSLRRKGPVIAVLLGAFALTLGVALPQYAYPRLAMVPLDPETISVSQGRASTLFDRANLVQRRNVDLTATVKVRGDLGAPEAAVGGDVAVWMAGTVVSDSSGVVRATTEQRVCLDRHTNVAIPDCTRQYVANDARVDDQIRQSGQVLKFPFDTQRRDYPFFDSSTRTVAPMVFAGTDTVDKLPVYRFVQSIPQTRIEDVTLPGALVNRPDVASVDAERTFQVNRAVWIEPASGLIIRDQQAIRQVLREPDGPDGTVALEVTLTSTPDTVRRSVARALQARTQLRLISGTVPSVLAGTGLLLLGAGLFVTVRRRRHAADWIDR
jgi:hypothetical protein